MSPPPEMPEPTDLGDGYTAVPHDAVTLNGMFLPQLLESVRSKAWAVIGPDRKALKGESGGVYRYESLTEAREDVAVLKRIDAEAVRASDVAPEPSLLNGPSTGTYRMDATTGLLVKTIEPSLETPEIPESILKLSLDEIRQSYWNSCRDWAEDDEHLEKLCLAAGIPEEQVHGDSYYRPAIAAKADMLAQRLEAAERRAADVSSSIEDWLSYMESEAQRVDERVKGCWGESGQLIKPVFREWAESCRRYVGVLKEGLKEALAAKEGQS